MKNSRFARRHVLGFAASALVALALISCGSLTRAGSEATEYAIHPAPFCVAPVDGSPEEAALADGHCPNSWWHAAPIDGTPEQTVAENGR